eukprot:1436556-Prymnesium_polylepis.1
MSNSGDLCQIRVWRGASSRVGVGGHVLVARVLAHLGVGGHVLVALAKGPDGLLRVDALLEQEKVGRPHHREHVVAVGH